MSQTIEARLDVMKREIDELQIASSAKSKPWYYTPATILSLTALLFSFGTTYVSYKRTAATDLQSARQELRGLLQRLAALPKEQVATQKSYADNPQAMSLVGGYINQENALIARQAAEIAKRLPEGTVSGVEHFAIAVALQNAYDLAAAAGFLDRSIAVTAKTGDFNTEIAALRMAANLEFIQGRPEQGRAAYQKALDIFSKYPGFDPFTRASTHVWTELNWAYSEANNNALSLAAQHAESAAALIAGLPPSPGANMLRAQIQQAKAQLASGVAPTQPPAGTAQTIALPALAPVSRQPAAPR